MDFFEHWTTATMTDAELCRFENETSDLCASLAADSEKLLSKVTDRKHGDDLMATGDIVNFALRVLGFTRPNNNTPDQSVAISSYGLTTDLERYEKWARNGSEGTFCFQERGTVRNWNLFALLSCFDASRFADQTTIRRVAFPIFGGFHWSLLVLDRYKKEFRFYDSILGAHDSRAYMLRSMLVAGGVLRDPWPIVRAECTKQRGGWECGYSLIGCAAHESRTFIAPGVDGLIVAGNRDSIAMLAAFLLARSDAVRKTLAYLKSRLQNYMWFE